MINESLHILFELQIGLYKFSSLYKICIKFLPFFFLISVVCFIIFLCLTFKSSGCNHILLPANCHVMTAFIRWWKKETPSRHIDRGCSLEMRDFFYTIMEAISHSSRSRGPEGKPQCFLLPLRVTYWSSPVFSLMNPDCGGNGMSLGLCQKK